MSAGPTAPRSWSRIAIVTGLAVTGCATAVQAQSYPAHPVRLIVPFAAGGNADILARIVGQKLGEALGQQIVIDNRAGANGLIGTELAAKAAPDGHTLLFIASGHAINPALYAKVPFDPQKDFAGVAQTSSTPLLIAVTAALPARTVKELAGLAKRRPGDLSYASQGNGSPGHLAGALLNSSLGINILHIPYKSTSQALTDLASGQVQVMYPSMTSVLPHVKGGRLRALSVTSPQRSSLAPEVPTAAESGIPGYEASIWNGVLAPAATPRNLVTRLNALIVKLLQVPDTRERIQAAGADVITGTPEAFDTFIATEMAKWGRVVRTAGVRLD